MQRLIVIAAVVAVFAGLVLGFLAIGPPAVTRRKLFDEQRLSDLRTIAETIRQSYGAFHELDRRSMVPVVNRPDGSSIWNDPETGSPYGYTLVDGSHYDLCAVFSGPSDAEDAPLPKWKHGAGRTCFRIDARKSDFTTITTVPYIR